MMLLYICTNVREVYTKEHIFFLSEQCHVSISYSAICVELICIHVCIEFYFQLELFNNIKPLFANKPLMVCVNKIDVLKLDELTEDKQVQYNNLRPVNLYFCLMFIIQIFQKKLCLNY